MPHPGLKVATNPTFDGKLIGKVIIITHNNPFARPVISLSIGGLTIRCIGYV